MERKTKSARPFVDGGAGADGGAAPACPELQALLVARNRISSWTSLHALDRLPSLCEVRLTGNPLTEGVSPSIARLEVIARMARLTALNGSSVRAAERRDAEIRYVQLMLAEVDEELGSGQGDAAAAEAARRAVAGRHPRFGPLHEQYGASVTRAGASAGGRARARPGRPSSRCRSSASRRRRASGRRPSGGCRPP